MIISFQTNREELGAYLKEQHFINPDETVLNIEKPGEGNMNFVARISTQKGSIIIKQANPFVQKYPQIAAPQERVLVETEFYQMIKKYMHLASYMPEFIGMDPVNHVIALQDLGDATDFTFLYQKGKKLNESELEQLIHFLNELHGIPPKRLTDYSKNLALRRLNHEHLFVYPFMEENGFNLNQVQQGLHDIAASYKSDNTFKNTVKALGEIYLTQGNTLLHGDYYPGSWLKTKDNLKIIDPEFSFVGNREFELGIFIAHLKMSEAPGKQIDSIRSLYHAGTHFNWKRCYQFAGIEIMRRIIGLAQLPLNLMLEEKESLLEEAHTYIVKP
jgi:5-methylthioribose kinase